MRLTIDALDGTGEQDWTSLLDAEAPPKIVRKLNEAPRMTAVVAAKLTAAAGSKARLYRDDGGLWFDGYLETAAQMTCAGMGSGAPVFRSTLHAVGELSALDHQALTERAAMGGLTAGQAVKSLAAEANAGFASTAVQDVAQASAGRVESGERWTAAVTEIANNARAVLEAQNRALTMSAAGTVTRTLSDSDAGFVPQTLKITVGPVAANDITVIGGREPAQYMRDAFTATGTQMTFSLTADAYGASPVVLVADDFHAMALDAAKWVNDAGSLTFTQGGVATAGAAALRYRNRVEVGGLLLLEQTGISYTSGQGMVGGLYSGGRATANCLAGVLLNNGQVQPVVNGVAQAAIAQTLTAGMLYEFRTLVFHPEPIRAGQVYASSTHNGAQARTSQVWAGTTHVVLTMRQINPADHSTLSGAQVVIYDGTMQGTPGYADYLPLCATNLACTLGQAAARNLGAVWVQSYSAGRGWRTRVLGDVTAGAECRISGATLHFTPASEPVLNEFVDVFYRTGGLACGRVVAPLSVQALATSEDAGTRSLVAHVESPAPRTSLDCEQAARALLDDLTQSACAAEYEAWISGLPQGATDVRPGETWTVQAAAWGTTFTALVREVEIAFAGLSDARARFLIKMANEAAQAQAMRWQRAQHNALITVVSSQLQDDVSARPTGLPDARFTTWTATQMTLDMGTDPPAGGGFEVRVEGDWGWGMTINQNLVGRYTTRTLTLPNATVTQRFYVRQFDASTPPRYSTYSAVLNMDVPS